MRISDLVSQRILEILNSQNGTAEICRNELAQDIGCVPSQINYVLTSRFTPEHGYIIESRRGGGGYVRITRVQIDKSSALMHLINSVGYSLDFPTARAILGNLLSQGIVSKDFALAATAALSDKCYRGLSPADRDTLRAVILKEMLITVL